MSYKYVNILNDVCLKSDKQLLSTGGKVTEYMAIWHNTHLIFSYYVHMFSYYVHLCQESAK